MQDREREGYRTGDSRVERLKIEVAEKLERIGFVAADVGNGAAGERTLGFDDRLAPHERNGGSQRAAAEDVENERVGFTPLLPVLGRGDSDRRSDRPQLLHLIRVGVLFSQGDADLDVLQIVHESRDLPGLGLRG